MGHRSARSYVVAGKATPLGPYPHVKLVGRTVFVSGTSSRRADDSIAGAELVEGATVRDIRVQTRAVIENIGDLLGTVGAGLADLVQLTCYLVSMDDFDGFNEAYADYFDDAGPTRTTVAVHQLPHPDLAIEIQAVAVLPARPEEEEPR
jgi:2-aminomuconate deaminase